MMIALLLSDITDDKMAAFISAFTATKTNTKSSRAKLFTSSYDSVQRKKTEINIYVMHFQNTLTFI